MAASRLGRQLRDLVEIFELLREPELSARYNIAPTQRVAVVRQSGKVREVADRGGRKARKLQRRRPPSKVES